MQNHEIKNLVHVGMYCFVVSLVIGLVGSLFDAGSRHQVLLYSINDTLALAGCVLIGRYVGIRGQHIAASGFVMLGIVHGISAGSSIEGGINLESVRLVIPLIPSVLLIAWSKVFPNWLRILGIISAIPFIILYYSAWSQGLFNVEIATISYVLLALVEIAWGILMVRDYHKTYLEEQSEA
ncbi:MAG: hypothetical protein R2794_10870 [Chitinophagales bacterium]